MIDDGDVEWQRIDKWRFALYGGTITLLMDIVIYPLEVLKTRMMIDTKSKATVVESFINTLRATLHADGVRGLFRGFFLYTAGGLPSQGAYFAGYAWSKDRLVAAGVPPALAPLAAGFFADAVAAPLWIPSEVITSRMQIQGPGVVAYSSSLHAAQSILREEGVAGLFRGLGAQVLAFGPASALWWASYEATAEALARWTHPGTPREVHDSHLASTSGGSIEVAAAHSHQQPLWIHALSGLTAGLITSFVTNPIDVAKTRLQTQHSLLREYDAQARGKRGEEEVGEQNVSKTEATALEVDGILEGAMLETPLASPSLQSSEKHVKERLERQERDQAARKNRKLQFFKALGATAHTRRAHGGTAASPSEGPKGGPAAGTAAPAAAVYPLPHRPAASAVVFGAASDSPLADAHRTAAGRVTREGHAAVAAAPITAAPSASAPSPTSRRRNRAAAAGHLRRGRQGAAAAAPVLRADRATRVAAGLLPEPHPTGGSSATAYQASTLQPGPHGLGTATAKGSSAPLVATFRPIAAVPFPAASTVGAPSGSALDAIRAAAKAAVSAAESARLGRLHRAPDSAAMMLQTAGRAAASAALRFSGRGATAAALAAPGAASAVAEAAAAGAALLPHAPHTFYPAAARGVRLHSSLWGVLGAIVRDEGAAALMRGLVPRLITNGPASAATLVAFELVKRWSTVPEGSPR